MTDEHRPSDSGSTRGTLWWLLSGLVAAGVLSVTASLMPPEFRKLGLLYAIYGAASGFVLAWLAREFQPRGHRNLALLAFFITAAGAVNLGWLSYLQFHGEAQRSGAQPGGGMMRQVLQADPEMLKLYEDDLRKFNPAFNDFLSYRVSGLGNWPWPLPQLFWGLEVSLAGALGAFLVRRSMSSTLPTHRLSQSPL